MTQKELMGMLELSEQGFAQFKERVTDKYEIGCEFCAFSNTKGGKLIIGVKNKTGDTNPLSYKEVQETTTLLAAIASDFVTPSIRIDIENIKVKGGVIVVANIPSGRNKPYQDSKGIIWKKHGVDKKRVMDKLEIEEMMEESGNFKADYAAVPDATFADLDEETIKLFFLKRFLEAFKSKAISELTLHNYSANEMAGMIIAGGSADQILTNIGLIRPDGQITTAALILFAKSIQRFLPTYTARCICFIGNSIGGTQFRDKLPDSDLEGNILVQYKGIMSFLKRNLLNVQTESEFNSPGSAEISYVSLVEYIVNTLVHRSLILNMPVRVFIFDDRVEIHTPGVLPHSLGIEDIKRGISMPRNTLLFQNAQYILPYTGAGSGIIRALQANPDAIFSNDEHIREFIVTIPRRMSIIKLPIEHRQAPRNLTEHQEKHQDTPRRPLTSKERDICNFCTVPRTAKEIMERIGICNQSRSRKLHIRTLLELGVLEMTDPEHPNSRNQKYRKKQ